MASGMLYGQIEYSAYAESTQQQEALAFAAYREVAHAAAEFAYFDREWDAAEQVRVLAAVAADEVRNENWREASMLWLEVNLVCDALYRRAKDDGSGYADIAADACAKAGETAYERFDEAARAEVSARWAERLAEAGAAPAPEPSA